jgi:hypothetical protein
METLAWDYCCWEEDKEEEDEEEEKEDCTPNDISSC